MTRYSRPRAEQFPFERLGRIGRSHLLERSNDGSRPGARLFAGLPMTGLCPTTPKISQLEIEADLMSEAATGIQTVDDLEHYVHERLCRHENLVADQFALEITPLIRRGALCGLQFLLRGPRSVRLGAVWASDHNLLYLYDARGERFHKEKLTGQFDVQLGAA
jgi:hypothetical protein